MRLNYDGSNQNGENGSGSDWFNDVKSVGGKQNSGITKGRFAFGNQSNSKLNAVNESDVSVSSVPQSTGAGDYMHKTDTYDLSNNNNGYVNSESYPQNLNNSSEAINVDRVFLHDKLVKAYVDLESEVAIANQSEVLRQEEIIKGQTFNDNFNNPTDNVVPRETQPQPEIKKGMSGGAIAGIIIGILAFLAVAGTLLFIMFSGKFDEPDNLKDKIPTVNSSTVSTKSISAVKDKINTLYSDSSKSSIKDGYTVSDLDSLRSELESYSDSKDYDKLVDELDTIELYLNDINVLKTYQDINYNIEPESVASDCDIIKSGLSDYSVSGLKTTVNSIVSSILSDRNTYLSIKDDLNGVEDVSTFNYDLYIEKAKGVKHTPNKTELITMCDDLLSKKNNSKDEDESKDDKKDEDSKDKNSEDKKDEDTPKEKPTAPPTESNEKPTEKKTEKPTEIVIEEVTESSNIFNALEDLVTAELE